LVYGAAKVLQIDQPSVSSLDRIKAGAVPVRRMLIDCTNPIVGRLDFKIIICLSAL
jgi:hypothetical protein